MILVDTSVWVAHFQRPQADLARWLEAGEVLTHAFVIGELACGTLRRRSEILSYLDRLAAAPLASSAEARELIERRRLMGQGLGWVDIHLLASCLIGKAGLWSLDSRLMKAAERLGVSA